MYKHKLWTMIIFVKIKKNAIKSINKVECACWTKEIYIFKNFYNFLITLYTNKKKILHNK